VAAGGRALSKTLLLHTLRPTTTPQARRKTVLRNNVSQQRLLISPCVQARDVALSSNFLLNTQRPRPTHKAMRTLLRKSCVCFSVTSSFPFNAMSSANTQGYESDVAEK